MTQSGQRAIRNAREHEIKLLKHNKGGRELAKATDWKTNRIGNIVSKKRKSINREIEKIDNKRDSLAGRLRKTKGIVNRSKVLSTSKAPD